MKQDLFEKAPIPKAYFSFAIPLVLGNIVTLVYNMVDTFFVAKTGDTNIIAGISLCAPIFTLLIALGDIFGLGGCSFISRLLGEKNEEAGRRVSVFSYYGALLFGVIIAAFLLIFRTPVLTLLGANEDTFVFASQYYTWLVLGAPFIVLNFVPMNQLRAVGLSKESVGSTIAGTIVNIILDPIFIFTLGLGAAGAAMATIIGYIVTDACFTWAIVKRSTNLSINPKYIKVSVTELKQILAIGFPASLTNFIQTIGSTFLNRSLLIYGTTQVASMGMVMKINMLITYILVGFAFGPQPLVGYNYGAKNHERLKKLLKFDYCFACCFALVTSIIMSFVGPHILAFMIDDAEVIGIGTTMMRIYLCGMVFVAFVLVSTTVFQSTGKSLGALLMAISRQGVIFCTMLAVLPRIFGYYGVLCAQPVSDCLTAVLGAVLMYKLLYSELKTMA